MKPKQKRVRAQRKFAQGAYIPPTTSQPTNLTAEVINLKENVVHRNNLSASNLLDVVSLKPLHAHRSTPVVLLERLAPTKELTVPNGGGSNLPTQTEEFSCEPVNQIMKPRPAKNNTMCLRSKVISQKRLLKRNDANRKHFKNPSKIKLLKRDSFALNRCIRSSVSVSDFEDGMPLTYLKRVLLSKRKLTEKRVTRARTQQQKSVGQAAGTQPNVELERINDSEAAAQPNVARKRKSTTFDTETPDVTTEPGDRPLRGGQRGKSAHNDIILTNTQPMVVLRRKSTYNNNTEAANQQTEPRAAKKDKTSGNNVFKEPAIPSRFSRAATQQESTRRTESPLNDLPSTSSGLPGQYYGQTGINRWLDSHTENSEGRTSPCPSESLKTVNDVVTASANTLSMLCKNCPCCRRVSLVEKISKLMQKQRRTSKDDVYEFDTDRDDNEDPAPFYVNRKRQNSQFPETHNAECTDIVLPNDEELLYLDLVNQNSHVIQLSAAKIPNSKTGIMQAKLIPKTAAQTTRDISLAGNENLLRQIFQTLQMSSSNRRLERETEQTNAEQTEAEQSEETETEQSVAARTVAEQTEAEQSVAEEPLAEQPQAARNLETASEPSIAGIGYDPRRDKEVQSPIRTPNVNYEEGAKLVAAPTFHPTEAEFTDPISYFEKIAPTAARYGICKVVAPPNFKPKCALSEQMKFNVSNHYISRLYSRWGPAAREMCAIKAYLADQNVTFHRVPLLDSLEVNLPKLCQIVHRNGGLHSVIEKKRWSRVAEEMRFNRGPHTEKTLDSYYVKYLLPYEAASTIERKQIRGSIEKSWNTKQSKMLNWSLNPLHAQKKLLGESESSDDSDDGCTPVRRAIINEAEDCIVSGRPMSLNIFKKVANNAMNVYMGTSESDPTAIEKEYWRLVLFGTDHVSVNAASIDTGAAGYGFTKNRTDPIGRHPWNLKMLSSNSGNVLRSLGSVLGVTVPTLHLGMVFSTSCWHRDPHGLPWMEYMHQGPSKIWYGIPDEQSANFRQAVEHLCPTSVQNKSIWLSSDITMIPPNLLRENNVSLSRAVQNPGEYIIVFPKAYSCSISTGFTVSESVYFANQDWLKTVHKVFNELRDSCEPTMFPLEQLLMSLARDARSPLGVLQLAHDSLSGIIFKELKYRRQLIERNLPITYSRHYKQKRKGVWDSRGEECKICRASLYLSKVTGVIGRRSVLCLLHAVRVLATPKFKDCDVSSMELVIYFKEEKLDEMITALQKRLERSD